MTDDLVSKDESSKKYGNFFKIDFNRIEQLIDAGADISELVCYLSICRGTKQIGSSYFSKYGMQSVQTRFGVSRYFVSKVLDRLKSRSLSVGAVDWFIKPFEQCTRDGDTPRGPSHFRWQISVSMTPRWIYLPNCLLDGLKDACDVPLTRIVPLSQTGAYPGCKQDALFDLYLLLYVYSVHDLQSCGGVDPQRGFFRYFDDEDLEGDDFSEGVANDFDLMIKKTSATDVLHFSGHLSMALAARGFERSHDETYLGRSVRRLQDAGLLYECLAIWDSDPSSPDGFSAEPLYTLHVSDWHARNSGEPYLARAVSRYAMAKGVIYASELFDGLSRNQDILFSERAFLFVEPLYQSAFPIGIFRLRYRADCRDKVAGIATEHERIAFWEGELGETSQRLGKPKTTLRRRKSDRALPMSLIGNTPIALLMP